MGVGIIVGKSVGVSVGAFVGEGVGILDGLWVGQTVGSVIGVKVGSPGRGVGTTVVGVSVSFIDSCIEG